MRKKMKRKKDEDEDAKWRAYGRWSSLEHAGSVCRRAIKPFALLFSVHQCHDVINGNNDTVIHQHQ